MNEQAFTVADVFRKGFEEYAAKAGKVPALHRRIAGAITDCRTEKLGGLVYRCDECASPLVLFHSCRNQYRRLKQERLHRYHRLVSLW